MLGQNQTLRKHLTARQLRLVELITVLGSNNTGVDPVTRFKLGLQMKLGLLGAKVNVDLPGRKKSSHVFLEEDDEEDEEAEEWRHYLSEGHGNTTTSHLTKKAAVRKGNSSLLETDAALTKRRKTRRGRKSIVVVMMPNTVTGPEQFMSRRALALAATIQ